MKRRNAIAAFLLVAVLAGCAAKQPAQTLPIGARDATDAAAFRVIADSHAFLKSVGDSVNAGTLHLNATQKSIYNSLVAETNLAVQLGTAYNKGQSNDAAGLVVATNKLNTDLTAAQSQIVVGVKP